MIGLGFGPALEEEPGAALGSRSLRVYPWAEPVGLLLYLSRFGSCGPAYGFDLLVVERGEIGFD